MKTFEKKQSRRSESAPVKSLLNTSRPPVFCPGCSHERVVFALDQALCNMNLTGDQVVIVSDIGCSGLFDTFFNTHAMHGLHGRALTYAAGIKLARPGLHVIVTMGDGGIGIGGAHLLSACRRNLDITLLVLNNFNIGMTGGQFSPTTPCSAETGSGFLNRLEKPMDICHVAASAGAPYAARCSAYRNNLPDEIEKAIRFEGFSVLDIRGACTGRYTRQNRLTPEIIQKEMDALPAYDGAVEQNRRKEYGKHYRELSRNQPLAAFPVPVVKQFEPPGSERHDMIILGSAGQKIITAGEIVCLAGMTAGLNVSLKNEYNITVLRGPSISEIVLSPNPIDFTGITRPDVILALDMEGVRRREHLFANPNPGAIIIRAAGVALPDTAPSLCYPVDFKSKRIRASDTGIAALIFLAKLGRVISTEMLQAAFQIRFRDESLDRTMRLLDQI